MTESRRGCILLRAAERPRGRLFLLSPAGSSVSRFGDLCQGVGPWIDCIGLEYPGHGSRWGEPLLESVDALAEDALSRLDATLPFILFGHSLGALVAYELCVRLEQSGRNPACLIVSGRRAPGFPSRRPQLGNLPDSQLVQRLQSLGGIPDEAVAVPELMDLILPVLRADVRAAERYAPQNVRRLSSPVYALGGLRDESVSGEELEAWRSLAMSDYALKYFDGGHFYVWEDTANLTSFIKSKFEVAL